MPRVVLSRQQRPALAVTPARILKVAQGSPAASKGVRPGWELLTVNGVAIPDVLAYRRELAAGRATLEVRPSPNEGSIKFDVEWEEPGLEFEDVIFDGIRL
ncbi:MAG: hypothetical protein KF813_13865, partial [Trueperaceae bacterium]|nr:hypothetical protein [Trueperaceae bacterium]